MSLTPDQKASPSKMQDGLRETGWRSSITSSMDSIVRREASNTVHNPEVRDDADFDPSRSFYLAILSLFVLALAAALGSTSLSIALPVCLHHHGNHYAAADLTLDNRRCDQPLNNAGILARIVKFTGFHRDTAELRLSSRQPRQKRCFGS